MEKLPELLEDNIINILEIARIALSNIQSFNLIASKIDLDDDELNQLKVTIQDYMQQDSSSHT